MSKNIRKEQYSCFNAKRLIEANLILFIFPRDNKLKIQSLYYNKLYLMGFLKNYQKITIQMFQGKRAPWIQSDIIYLSSQRDNKLKIQSLYSNKLFLIMGFLKNYQKITIQLVQCKKTEKQTSFELIGANEEGESIIFLCNYWLPIQWTDSVEFFWFNSASFLWFLCSLLIRNLRSHCYKEFKISLTNNKRRKRVYGSDCIFLLVYYEKHHSSF